MLIAIRSLGLWHYFQLFASQFIQGLQFNYSPPIFRIFHPSLTVAYERLLSLLNLLMFNQYSCAYRYLDSCPEWVRMLDLTGRQNGDNGSSSNHLGKLRPCFGLRFSRCHQGYTQTCLRRTNQAGNARNKGKGVWLERKNAFLFWNILLVLSCFSSYVLMPLALC